MPGRTTSDAEVSHVSRNGIWILLVEGEFLLPFDQFPWFDKGPVAAVLNVHRDVKPANLLVLDEPTNDLDVNTLRALEETVENFAGCAIVVSHDRWFLDRVATHILAFEGDSQIVFREGNYSDYEADRHQKLGLAADTPHRIQYKKLTR